MSFVNLRRSETSLQSHPAIVEQYLLEGSFWLWKSFLAGVQMSQYLGREKFTYRLVFVFDSDENGSFQLLCAGTKSKITKEC